jgi:hypothetical protein
MFIALLVDASVSMTLPKFGHMPILSPAGIVALNVNRTAYS